MTDQATHDQQLFQELEQLDVRDQRMRDRMDAIFTRQLQTFWTTSQQPGAFSRSTAMTLPKGKEIFAKLSFWAKRWGSACRKRTQAVREEISRLAQDTPIPVDETGVIYFRTDSSQYQSQGFGANKYAKGAAVMALVQIQGIGVKAVLEEEKLVLSPTVSVMECRVRAYTTKFGAEICRLRKKGPMTKEQARTLLKMNVNLRVYDPYLAHDWERELGLDAFGNDLKVRRVPVLREETAPCK